MNQRNRNILQTLLILSPFVLTFAFVRLFVDLDDLDKVNKGTLIVPHVQMIDLAPRQADGEYLTVPDLAQQWWLVYLADGHCDSACKNALYYLIRQLRLSLGEDSRQVARLVMHTAQPDADLREFLDTNVSGMREVTVDRQRVENVFDPAFPGENSPVGRIFVMSPDGQIILWYPSHEEQQAVLLEADNILADLKRILKGTVN